MIHELSGDILFSGARAIVQGVAPNDDFLHGLAMQLRERLPAMYKEFRQFCKIQHPKSGGLWTWKSVDGRFIVNLLTHEAAYGHGAKPGRATVSNVNHSLHALRDFVKKEKIPSLALPRLACGLTGLDWDEIRPLIEKHLGDLGVPVYVYVTYQKGIKANEPPK